MIPEFPHNPPTKEYFYEYEQFNSRMITIWLCCSRKFDYNLGKPTRTIWGFYSPKKQKYFSPINSKNPGKEININHTNSYTAMPIAKTPLETAFL